MQKFLSKESYKQVLEAIDSGGQIQRSVAEQVATAMMAWAISKGATHYTHWFQPLTGSTAEKHDSFFELADGSKEISVSTIANSNSIKGGRVTISSFQRLAAFALYDNLKTGNYSYAGINAVDVSN